MSPGCLWSASPGIPKVTLLAQDSQSFGNRDLGVGSRSQQITHDGLLGGSWDLVRQVIQVISTLIGVISNYKYIVT